jgi:methionyl-tRNA formyltransferase
VGAVEPGTIVTSKRSIAAVCGDGMTLELLELQPANRKALSGADFVNGMRVVAGEKFHEVADN